MLKRIKILSDESVVEIFSCLAEHGFSAYIETTEGCYLWDTGRGDVIIRNAYALDVDLSKLDAIVLSHGHYDHTGGLEQVLKITGPIDVYAHPGIFEKKWLITKNSKIDISNPFSKERLEELGARFQYTTEPTQLSATIWVTGQIKRHTGIESADSNLYVERDGVLTNDEILDDQAMYIVDPDGVNIILGCTHSGIENTLIYISKISQSQKIKFLMGGLHLFKTEKRNILSTIEKIKKYNVDKIAVSHCTGLKSLAFFQNAFKEKFEITGVGSDYLF